MRARTRIIMAGLALGAALAGGVAWATIPDGSGVYTACKLNVTGTIRLIDPSLPSSSFHSKCTNYETKITWNQQGPAGPMGATGPAGPVGPKGETGPGGADGAQGPKGDTGAAGPTGPQGPQGDQGPPGAAGASGVSGYEIVMGPWTTVGGLFNSGTSVFCPVGKRALGGGGETTGMQITGSHPQPNVPAGTFGWRVTVFNGGVTLADVRAYVVCASV